MSRAAKQILKEKKRKKRLGTADKEPEVSSKGLWIVVFAVLIIGVIVAASMGLIW